MDSIQTTARETTWEHNTSAAYCCPRHNDSYWIPCQ